MSEVMETGVVRCRGRQWAVGLPLLLLALASGAVAAEAAVPQVATRPPAAPPVEGVEAAAEPGTQTASDPDTIRAGRFDNGRMWTFEYPPVAYFQETYGFTPDSAWLRKARLGALRIPGCSASFVSATGLVMTNHHCAREHVSAVTRAGETLLDDGFYAASLEDERPVEGFEADRLVAILDVTDEVDAALEGVTDDVARSQRRESVLEEIEARVLAEHGGEEAGMVVEMISLYAGGRTSAYVFRRYTDVRLVMAPELDIGFFGGDPDNFTYPRYSLDMSFFRVYGDDKQPLDTGEDHFTWSLEGVREGDPVFVIGNPGSTSRLQTVAELEFRRDVSDRGLLAFVDRRIEALQEYYESDPVKAEELDLRNSIFSLMNTQKAYRGMLRGLGDPVIMARRRDTQRQFLEDVRSDPALSAEYGDLVDRMAEVQRQKAEHAPAFGAFLAMTNAEFGSATLVRALYAYQYVMGASQGAPPQALEGVKQEILGVPRQPAALEELLVEARLLDLVESYGPDSELVQQVLEGRTPEGAAAVIVGGSALSDSAATARALETGALDQQDPAIRMMGALLEAIGPFQRAVSTLFPREEEIAARIGRARFEIYGTDVPPDATFSLRIADGVVAPYEYNGTEAPIVTTFYGLYDRHYSFATGGEPREEWALPDRWLDPPSTFDLSTPLNFVATPDIIGGNSGSPLVNRNLEVVGLAFDGNIESLPGDYIFLTESARTVAVDARGILEALAEIYGADRIVQEMTAGAGVGSGRD